MEQLHEFFNIPPYYSNLTLEIHSENLMPLLNENPIDYMRHLYSTDSKLFYNVRDELVLRGIGFQPEYHSNYLLDRKYEIQHILYKNDNTYAFEKIDFAMLGANNFIERFNVRSDLFFKNMPLEGMLHFTQGVSFVLLQEIFKEAGFLIVSVNEYMTSPIHAVGIPYEIEGLQTECYEEEKSLGIVPTNDVSMLDAPVKYFYEDTIYLTFLKYCHVNGIRKFSELTVDFVGKYRYQKHVRTKTAIKVMELYHEIHRKFNALQFDVSDAITLLQNNSFKSIVEFINLDYLTFIDDFYAADELGMYQADFPFEKAQKVCQQVIDSSDEILAEKQQQQFNQLISEIGDHPKFKYVLSYSLAEMQEMFEITWDNSLDLQLCLFDVLDDMNYKKVFSDILVELNHMKDIQEVLEKVASVINPRELEVLLLRRTKTLQEVGDVIDVTRERIRQIEVKGRNRLVAYKKQLNLKQYFQYCTEHSKLLTLDDFMQAFEIEGDLYKTLLDIFFDIDDSITYLSELDRYILTSDYEGIRENIEKIDYSQPIIEIDELKQLFNEDIFNFAREVVDLLIRSHNYKRVKNIYVRKTISIIARINYLFKHVIKEPLEMDDAGYELFKQYMEDTFDIPFDSSKRSVTARIAAGENVILVDGNTFALHNGEAITDDFLAKMEQVIDERLTVLEYVDPRWIFKEYTPLMQQIGLHSPEHLYSIIQLYLGDKYETGHRNTLYIFKTNADRLDAETILLNYLRSHGHEAKREAILEDLNWKDFKLDQLIPRLKTVVMVSNNIVKTIESFNFTDEELVELKNVIERELEKGYVFTYDLQFELAFNEKLESLIERCKLTDDVTLAAIMKWLYPNINGYSKLLYWSNSPITKIEQAISAEFPEFIVRNEMLEFVEGKGYSEQTVARLPADILRDGLFYNYTNTKYINANLLTFTDEVKQSLASYLQQQFESKAYCPIFSLVGYSQVLTPISSYEWTEYLIGQFAEHIGYRKIQTHIDYRFDKPFLVKSDKPIENFEQLVLHIVKTEYTGRYHEEDLAKYLVSKKIAHNPRRLTNEIYNSPLFKFDSFGFFEIRGENGGTN
ncbi:sigma factor-like helix-turn-helix DNA-binding protein [Bacillus proteolyticus]|uniref:sigma factor-like helix-turn-helix DNA-binding protein n=1 Tax=Bacillus proteolyticus TaxID=2026192 RepID=UPI002E1E28EA|nr:sigma factor-like helix-turn-helix DNA-binding protein [Bacillus proteolyticus]